MGAADDFQVLHDAHPESYSILIDPNFMYENIYKNILKSKKGEYHICGLSDKSYKINIIFIQKSHICPL